MSGLNWANLESATLRTDPFDHMHVLDAVDPDAARRIPAEFPDLRAPGSFSLQDAPPGPVLTEVIRDLESDRFRSLMASRFGVDLDQRPTTVTLRGACSARDGSIHTDSRSKILSLLLYLNETWDGADGQLRLLRSGQDINAVGVEIPAVMGSLVVFRRSDNSWHGHTPYFGQRRVLQLNYVQSERSSMVTEARHRISALLKRRRAA
jgi:hypothetical protein